MALTQIQKQRIREFVPGFKEYLSSGGRQADLSDRRARCELYAQLLSPEGLARMTELEFGQVISSLWASEIWGDKGYLVDKLIADNGLPRLVDQLRNLLWGSDALATRYDAFREQIRGLGPASTTELLAFVHPDRCGLWNDKVRKALRVLGFGDSLHIIRKTRISGREYEEFNRLLSEIGRELEDSGVPPLDLLGVDYFLFEVWSSAKDATPGPGNGANDFDHEDMVQRLVAIGRWLGFDTEVGSLVATAARVDVIWQARIANLGVVTYVFEVQRRGSADSLILNLQRAQNNPSVQRLVVVANADEIERVRGEIATLPERFRRAVGYMEVKDLVRAGELLEEFAEIIGRLELVQSQFGARGDRRPAQV